MLDTTRLQETSHRVIIGVDFGTTFTGISWINTATDGRIQDVTVMNQWAGSAKTSDYNWKVPTAIAYKQENPNVKMSEDKWGFEVKPQMLSWTWMKLLLEQEQATAHYKDALQDVVRHPSKSPEQIITDFLHHLYIFLIEKLEKALGQATMQQLPFQFWFTVPAIWSDRAKHATRTAATNAGFGSRSGDQLFLIPEPEAAAVSVLRELTFDGSSFTIQPGNGVLVCDCGGGTVDITTYKVIQTQPTLRFEELLVGTGAKCGSTSIDRRFLTWMSMTFPAAFDMVAPKHKRPGSKFMKDFETAKRDFKAGGDDPYEVCLAMPGVEDSDVYDEDVSTVKIAWLAMKSFFQPAVKRIIAMIKEQVRQAGMIGERIHEIILVGGLGDSHYLSAELKRVFTSLDAWSHIEVLCPKHPQAAVVKGAAFRGLENLKSESRKCRRHYGFVNAQLFREGDPPCDWWKCPFTDRAMCANRVQWAMSKGQPMNEETWFSIPEAWWQTVEQTRTPSKIRLVCSSSDQQAQRSYDYGVESVGEVSVLFHALDFSKFRSKYYEGMLYYEVTYFIQVFPVTQEGVLLFKVWSQNREVGLAKIEYPQG